MAVSALTLGCTSPGTEVPSSGETVTIKLTVEAGGEVKEETVQVPKGSNGLQAMKEKFDVIYSESLYGAFMKSIDGVEADSKHFWALFVNENFADKAIDRYVFQEDAEIKWRMLSVEEGMKYWG